MFISKLNKIQLNCFVNVVQLILEDRFPVPNLIICNQGHGKERYLKSKVNPSVMDASNPDWQVRKYFLIFTYIIFLQK